MLSISVNFTIELMFNRGVKPFNALIIPILRDCLYMYNHFPLFLSFVTFTYAVPGQVQYLIVSIPDLCLLLYYGVVMIVNVQL